MADSSFMDSSMPDHQEDLEEIPVTWVSLTREEDLEGRSVLIFLDTAFEEAERSSYEGNVRDDYVDACLQS